MSHVAEPRIITGSGSNPIGPASGDLGGTYPAPSVLSIHGAAVPIAGSLTIGNILQVSGSSALSYGALDLSNNNSVTNVLGVSHLPNLAGDVTGTITVNSVVKINGASVPAAGGGLITGNVLQVTGSSALGYAAINLAGGSSYVTGVLPSSNQAAQTMAGDVTGTTAASTVVKLQNRNVSSSAPVTGDVLTWDGSSWVPDSIPVPGVNVYGCFSDSSNQPVLAKDTATVWKYNTTEIAHGVSITNNLSSQPTRITVSQTGIYEFAFSGQINTIGGSPATASIWARKNDLDVTRSTSTLDLGGSVVTQLPYVSFLFDMNANDYIEFVFSATQSDVRLLALGAQTGPVRPAAPSVIIVVKKISD